MNKSIYDLTSDYVKNNYPSGYTVAHIDKDDFNVSYFNYDTKEDMEKILNISNIQFIKYLV